LAAAKRVGGPKYAGGRVSRDGMSGRGQRGRTTHLPESWSWPQHREDHRGGGVQCAAKVPSAHGPHFQRNCQRGCLIVGDLSHHQGFPKGCRVLLLLFKKKKKKRRKENERKENERRKKKDWTQKSRTKKGRRGTLSSVECLPERSLYPIECLSRKA